MAKNIVILCVICAIIVVAGISIYPPSETKEAPTTQQTKNIKGSEPVWVKEEATPTKTAISDPKPILNEVEDDIPEIIEPKPVEGVTKTQSEVVEKCGNTICDNDENWSTCNKDCKKPIGVECTGYAQCGIYEGEQLVCKNRVCRFETEYCGDGVCDKRESRKYCPRDCVDYDDIEYFNHMTDWEEYYDDPKYEIDVEVCCRKDFGRKLYGCKTIESKWTRDHWEEWCGYDHFEIEVMELGGYVSQIKLRNPSRYVYKDFLKVGQEPYVMDGTDYQLQFEILEIRKLEED